MIGYSAAAVAILIWAAYPVATRAGVTGSFAPQDLLLLRFGVGGLLFVPWLLLHFPAIGRQAWHRGIALALFQGAGMGALVVCGLQFAPANHAAALGPGVSPAWLAVLGFALFARRCTPRMAVGAALCAAGVFVLAWWSAAQLDMRVLAGDVMFLAASALGSLYVLQLRRWGIGAMHGAAIVSVYSAFLVVPAYLCFAEHPFQGVAPLELLWQVLWQGILIGCVGLIAFNQAIARLGTDRTTALVAAVPALSAVLALLFLDEVPSRAELAAIVAISAGVSLAASSSYVGSPAACKAAAKRSA